MVKEHRITSARKIRSRRLLFFRTVPRISGRVSAFVIVFGMLPAGDRQQTAVQPGADDQAEAIQLFRQGPRRKSHRAAQQQPSRSCPRRQPIMP